jgi:hypothetical protein
LDSIAHPIFLLKKVNYPLIIFMYTDSFDVTVRTAAWPGRSVLEAERRRVGLDEDGPEYLHVLARARLDVIVQDVDTQLCLIIIIRTQNMSTQEHQTGTRKPEENRREQEQQHVLFLLAECMRIHIFLSGESRDWSQPMTDRFFFLARLLPRALSPAHRFSLACRCRERVVEG